MTDPLEIRAITVKQPWASAIIYGGKDVENRTTNIVGSYRGPLAIIAGKTKADVLHAPQRGMLFDLAEKRAGYPLALGAIIGVVDLVDVHLHRSDSAGCFVDDRPSFCSPWGDVNANHLVLKNPRPLPTPIPVTGFLGCRRLPPDLVLRIAEQLTPKCDCPHVSIDGADVHLWSCPKSDPLADLRRFTERNRP